jgi:hypothetical protein
MNDKIACLVNSKKLGNIVSLGSEKQKEKQNENENEKQKEKQKESESENGAD